MQKRHPYLPRLRNVKQIEHVVTVVVVVLLTAASALSGQERVTLRAARLLDGRGGVVTNPVVVMDGGSIQTIRSQSGDVDYDLTDLTVLPGLIDTHVHVGWHFDPDGRLHSDDTESAETSALYAAENAYKMLMAGFTTVQSLGSLVDKPLRDAIDRGVLPGPRILTSLRSIGARTGEPRRDPHLRAQAEERRRGHHQNLRLREHSRRRHSDDVASSARRCLRRGAGAGPPGGRPCARAGKRAAFRRSGLHDDRARRAPRRRDAEPDGGARGLFRPKHSSHLPELFREQRPLSRDRQLQRRRLCTNGEGRPVRAGGFFASGCASQGSTWCSEPTLSREPTGGTSKS